MLLIVVISEYADVDFYDSETGLWSEVWIDRVYIVML